MTWAEMSYDFKPMLLYHGSMILLLLTGRSLSLAAEAIIAGILRLAYCIFFLIVWLDAVASFYHFGSAFRNGALTPNALQSEPLSNHGDVVYITSAEKKMIEILQTGMAIGIPSVLFVGAILHFILGIPLFPDASVEEWGQRTKCSVGQRRRPPAT